MPSTCGILRSRITRSKDSRRIPHGPLARGGLIQDEPFRREDLAACVPHGLFVVNHQDSGLIAHVAVSSAAFSGSHTVKVVPSPGGSRP